MFLKSTKIVLGAFSDTKPRFAPSTKWLVDTLLRILTIAGDLVPDEVRASLSNTIAREPSLHSYAAHAVYQALNKGKDYSQQPLVQGIFGLPYC